MVAGHSSMSVNSEFIRQFSFFLHVYNYVYQEQQRLCRGLIGVFAVVNTVCLVVVFLYDPSLKLI